LSFVICHLSSGGNNFYYLIIYYFPDNQLTKFSAV